MSLKPYAIRNRSSNFSKMEKMLVANLCRDNPDIDAKEYDKFTLQRKHEAWENVMVLYREEISKKDFSFPERDIKQLQGCWKRIKDQIRRRNNMNIKTQNTSGEANESYEIMTNGYPTMASGEPFSVTADIYENDESEDESSADNSNCQNQITVDKSPAEIQQDHVSFNPLLRIKEEIIPPDESTSWKGNDSAISFINTSVSGQSPQITHVQNVQTLQRTTYPIIKRGEKRSLQKDDDPYVQMAMKEHHVKMKILQLKEWKLRKECLQAGIGLPPDYEPP
ncbi:uncharacterized protein LOC121372176 [Gigantopelta aegis]|uniref:uncharacterized protein LOC121372176 n=1 Tax=Gigantopelta aegis TaxID=1735272 RepID=UPI001B88C640|nr:uncharacterized protein LOC121372176 [Gigantopelta aegis]